MNIGLVLFNLLIFILGAISTIGLWLLGYPLLSFIVLLFTSAALLIFSHPKFYLARFLFPGITTFTFLTVLPIIFTLFISGSNWSTGHFFSKDQVMEMLLEESYLPQEASTFSFELYGEGSTTLLIGQDFYLSLPLSLENQTQFILRPITSDIESIRNQARKFSPREVIDFFSDKKDWSFSLPGKLEETPLRFYRSSALAPLEKVYTKGRDGGIIHQKTGEVFHPDSVAGKYLSEEGHALSPGFYTWVGAKNYLSLFSNPELRSSFIKVFIWTMVWGVMSVLLTFSLGVSLAIIVNDKNLKLKSLYRNLLILPYSIPFFISVLIFKGMMNKDFGLINQALALFSLPAVPWLDHLLWAKAACLLVNLWLGFPYMFLITTGVLQSIPESVYDAAKLDGAGPFVRFKKITLPLIMSAIAPLLIGSFAFNINNFVGIYLLTGGGPPMEGASTQVGHTDILISYTYRLAFEGGRGQDFGLASSIAVIIFLIVAIITVFNFRLFRTQMRTHS